MSCLRLSSLCLAASLFAAPHSSVFAVDWDDEGNPDTNWSNADNWAGDVEPTAAEDARIGSFSATVDQAGEVFKTLYLGDMLDGGAGVASLTVSVGAEMAGQAIRISTNNAAAGGGVGTLVLDGGAITLNETDDAGEAFGIGRATGTTAATFTMNSGTLDYEGGNFIVGVANGTTAEFNMVGGTIDGKSAVIIGDGSVDSTSTVNFSGGNFTHTGRASLTDGMITVNHSGGIWNIADDLRTHAGGGAATDVSDINITGGEINVGDQVIERNGTNTITVSGTGILTVGRDYRFTNTGARTGTLEIQPGGTVTIAGNLEDRLGTSVIDLSGGVLEFASANPATRTIDNYTQSGGKLVMPIVSTALGITKIISANGTIDITGGTVDIPVLPGDNTGLIATWTGGTATWDGGGGKWDVGKTPASIGGIASGESFDLFASINDMPNQALVAEDPVSWDITAPDAKTIRATTKVDLAGSPGTALLGTAAATVTFDGDLGVSPTIGSSAGHLQVDDGTLDIINAGDLVLGSSGGSGDVTHNAGVVNAEDLLFGDVPGVAGGTYVLNSGATLNLSGAVVETDAAVNGAHLHVDGGTLNVAGDITVQSFRTGNAAGTTGEYILPAGKTLTTTGTLIVGQEGSGTFTAEAGSTLVLGTDSGFSVEVGGAPTGVGVLNIHGAGVTSSGTVYFGEDAAMSTVTINDGATWTHSGGEFRNAEFAGSTSVLNIAGADTVIDITGGNFETAEDGAGTVNMSGGTILQRSNNMIVSQSATSAGEFNFSGGLIDLTVDSAVGNLNFNGPSGVFTQTGGELKIGNVLNMSDDAGASATFNLMGGSVSVASNLVYRGEGDDEVNISGGAFSVGGNITMTNPSDDVTDGNLLHVIGPAATSISVGGNLTMDGDATLKFTPGATAPHITPITMTGGRSFGGARLVVDISSMGTTSAFDVPEITLITGGAAEVDSFGNVAFDAPVPGASFDDGTGYILKTDGAGRNYLMAATVRDPFGDDDRDIIINRLEEAFGTDLDDANSGPEGLPQIGQVGGVPHLLFRQLITEGTFVYEIQESVDGAVWTTLNGEVGTVSDPQPAGIPAGYEQREFEITQEVGKPVKLLRLRVLED